jgi:hypothetical protein
MYLVMKKIAVFITFCSASVFVNAQTWGTVSTGMSGGTPAVYALASGINLYAGGNFTSAGGATVSNIAQWDGSAWSALGAGVDGDVFALTIYKGNLYAGGDFVHAGGVLVNGIAEWNGSNWSALGTGVSGGFASVYALAVYNGNLIVAGDFKSASGSPVSNIAQWNGSSWSTLGTGFDKNINTLDTVLGNLYAGGGFINDSTGATAFNHIAQWNGSSWSSLGTGMAGSAGTTVNSLYGIASQGLYAGGNFTTAGGMPVTNIALWSGSTWSDLGGSGTNSWVYSMTSFSGDLIMGGFFTTAGTKPANEIASYISPNWSALGTGLNGAAEAMAVYNGNLYVGGLFTTAGGITTNYIAQWGTITGVNKISNDGKANACPNPNNGRFSIQIANNYQLMTYGRIEIYNELGEKIYETSQILPNGKDLGWAIDISNQPKGVYLYRVMNEAGRLIGSGKVVIE